jgi:hypothetical protein
MGKVGVLVNVYALARALSRVQLQIFSTRDGSVVKTTLYVTRARTNLRRPPLARAAPDEQEARMALIERARVGLILLVAVFEISGSAAHGSGGRALVSSWQRTRRGGCDLRAGLPSQLNTPD